MEAYRLQDTLGDVQNNGNQPGAVIHTGWQFKTDTQEADTVEVEGVVGNEQLIDGVKEGFLLNQTSLKNKIMEEAYAIIAERVDINFYNVNNVYVLMLISEILILLEDPYIETDETLSNLKTILDENVFNLLHTIGYFPYDERIEGQTQAKISELIRRNGKGVRQTPYFSNVSRLADIIDTNLDRTHDDAGFNKPPYFYGALGLKDLGLYAQYKDTIDEVRHVEGLPEAFKPLYRLKRLKVDLADSEDGSQLPLIDYYIDQFTELRDLWQLTQVLIYSEYDVMSEFGKRLEALVLSIPKTYLIKLDRGGVKFE